MIIGARSILTADERLCCAADAAKRRGAAAVTTVGFM